MDIHGRVTGDWNSIPKNEGPGARDEWLGNSLNQIGTRLDALGCGRSRGAIVAADGETLASSADVVVVLQGAAVDDDALWGGALQGERGVGMGFMV